MWIVRGTKQIELPWCLSVTNQVTGAWGVSIPNCLSHRNLGIITVWLTSTRVRTSSFLSHQIFRGPFDLTVSQEWTTEHHMRVRWLTEQRIQALSYCWLGSRFLKAVGPMFWIMGTWLMNDLKSFYSTKLFSNKAMLFCIIYIYIYFFFTYY